MAYKPIYIKDYKKGLVQQRPNFILPNDAFPVLFNAFIFRETIRRKKGTQFIGRLRRCLEDNVLTVQTGASPWTFNLYTSTNPAITEPNAEVQCGNFSITIDPLGINETYTDIRPIPPVPLLDGQLYDSAGVVQGTINYITGEITINFGGGAGLDVEVTFCYYPSLPGMGTRQRELQGINVEETVFFDTKYAYSFDGTNFNEFLAAPSIPFFPATWTGSDSNFFWTTNFFVDGDNNKIFWATNFSGPAGDPIRFSNGIVGNDWVDFTPPLDGNADPQTLWQSLAILPFRGRLLCFNTYEGPLLGTIAGATQFRQRIRWSRIGTPFYQASVPPFPTIPTFSADGWFDTIDGRGDFLDIPTSENITGVGFIRDNLVVFCERSTWQLRYTNNQTAPFVIQKINSELGVESPFSLIQFDTSLDGIGDRGISTCDSYQTRRIDIKIPDLVFKFSNENEGPQRVHAARDYVQQLSYWTYVNNEQQTGIKYPNRRLVFNYENDSWAIFDDAITTMGIFQPQTARTWEDSTETWAESNFPWVNRPPRIPTIASTNQQGYVSLLDQNISNEKSLTIKAIAGNDTTATVVTSVEHNLETGQIISIAGIPDTFPALNFSNLNAFKFQIIRLSADTFSLMTYDPFTDTFLYPQVDSSEKIYIGCGEILVRDNFFIVSKKFNFLDQGQMIQIGYIDLLMNDTANGQITLNMYQDYAFEDSNRLPQNKIPGTIFPDPLFNATIPTSRQTGLVSSKNFQRIYCPVRANFITLELTLSNAQMIDVAQESDVQIDAQIIWARPAGSQLRSGG